MHTEALAAVFEIEAAYFGFPFQIASGFDMSFGPQVRMPILWRSRSY